MKIILLNDVGREGERLRQRERDREKKKMILSPFIVTRLQISLESFQSMVEKKKTLSASFACLHDFLIHLPLRGLMIGSKESFVTHSKLWIIDVRIPLTLLGIFFNEILLMRFF